MINQSFKAASHLQTEVVSYPCSMQLTAWLWYSPRSKGQQSLQPLINRSVNKCVSSSVWSRMKMGNRSGDGVVSSCLRRSPDSEQEKWWRLEDSSFLKARCSSSSSSSQSSSRWTTLTVSVVVSLLIWLCDDVLRIWRIEEDHLVR